MSVLARKRAAVLPGLVLGLAAMLTVPAVASATVSVGRNGDILEITDVSGVDDVIVFSDDKATSGGGYTVESTQPITRLDNTCSIPSTAGGKSSVHCLGLPFLLVTLGAGNDGWTDLHEAPLGSRGTPITVDGGLGNDSIKGSFENENLNGGDGIDTVLAGRGFNTLTGGLGDDVLSDGDDQTTVTGDVFSGGSGNDLLLIRRGGDVANGEAGNDTIVEDDPSQVSDAIDGGADTDTWALEGLPGVTVQDLERTANVFRDGTFGAKNEPRLEQTLNNIEGFAGTNGPDVMNGALSTGLPRTYNGRGGADVIVGSARADQVKGGNGRDALQGRDGSDTLDAKAGEVVAVPDELIDCGPGTSDTAAIDLLDPNPLGCETVARSAIGEGPHIRIGSVRRVRGRTYAVKLSCPRRLRHRCKGELQIALTERGLRRAKGERYSIRAGRRCTLRVHLTRRDAGRLRRLRRKRGFVRSTEKGDVAGRKTTLARRRLTRP